MNVLLDSHAFLWFVWEDPQLTASAKALIENPANRKKLNLGEPATTFLPRELSMNKFDVLGIELAHVTFIETLPPHHKDPFDRLLIAQSLLETMPIVSADAMLDPYGVTRLWK